MRHSHMKPKGLFMNLSNMTSDASPPDGIAIRLIVGQMSFRDN